MLYNFPFFLWVHGGNKMKNAKEQKNSLFCD